MNEDEFKAVSDGTTETNLKGALNVRSASKHNVK